MKYPILCLFAALALFGKSPAARGQDTGLIVHEWGTFTTQRRGGNANLAAFIKAFHLEGYQIPWYAALTR